MIHEQNGKQVPLCDISDDQLINRITYNQDCDEFWTIENELYIKEYKYRKANNIKIIN